MNQLIEQLYKQHNESCMNNNFFHTYLCYLRCRFSVFFFIQFEKTYLTFFLIFGTESPFYLLVFRPNDAIFVPFNA